MPTAAVTVEHKIGKAAAKEKLRPVVDDLIEAFQGSAKEISEDGDDLNFKFKSMAFNIEGKATVSDDSVLTEVKLPFAATIFKAKAERAITKYMTKALGS